MIIERSLLLKLKSVFLQRTPVIHVIIGPRQVGKTTVSHQLQKAIDYPSIYATADGPASLDSSWIETQWLRAKVEAEESKKPVMLILDEVQKVARWNETLKLLWDSRDAGQDIRLLILGSSSLLMLDGLSESLAGRFFLHRCGHWSFSECREAFDWTLDQWLFFGGYPGAAPFVQDEADWKRYVVDSLIETVLARDVLEMGKIAKPALLRHLFALAATLPAQCVSYNKMLGQLQDAGNTTTLAHYLKILDSAFLITGLELFSRNKQRKRGSSPKLILWNNAIINALSTRTFTEALRDLSWWGRLVENAVGGVFCQNLHSLKYSLSYWREGQYEVDFVIAGSENIWAIEVKSGLGKNHSGLSRFQKAYPSAKPMLIGAYGITLEEFFTQEPGRWFR